MSETRQDENITVTRYGGPADKAVRWYSAQSRLRFEIWRQAEPGLAPEKIADLNVREAAAMVGLLLELEPDWRGGDDATE